MRIGELARQAGVTASTLRFYEGRGLLPPTARLANGYRDYDEHALRVVRFVGRARGLGFTLGEVASHLRSPETGRKARLLSRLEAKLADLEALLQAAAARRTVIAALIDEVRGLSEAG